ncbi:MAG: glycosyltransferase family 2 protein [Acidobacteriota bacterium]
MTALQTGAAAAAPAGPRPELSVVVPVYNEVENLEPLYQALVAALEPLGRPWELVLVDDGSTDGSGALARRLSDADARVLVVGFRRNFGQTAALAAGFAHASGDVIVTLDADLQNDPADIPLLLAKLDEGWDLVNGWRRNRRDPYASRRLPSQVANRLISVITGLPLHDSGCTLKALRREIAQELRLYGEMHRFIPAMAAQLGARVVEVPVGHRPRAAGKSKYGIGRLFRVVLDLITVKFLSEYSTRPSHLFGLLGLLALLVGSSITGVLVFQRAVFKSPLADRPLLLLSIFMVIIGVQFVTMGLIGEMLSRVYHESQHKPIYVVREVYRGGDAGQPTGARQLRP